MYTTANRSYPDLLRSKNKERMNRIASRAISFSRAAYKGSSRVETSGEASNSEDEESCELEKFPAFVDPTEQQDHCIDPIIALKIPRSEYRNTKELELCRKNITRLHTNVQYLENLDTLVLSNNRISEVSFLLPPKRTANGNSRAENDAAVDDGVETLWCRPRGCHLLRSLFLSHNMIRTIDGDIPRLRHLRVLLLAYNRLANLVAVSTQLKRLRDLRELDLRGNPLCDELGYRPYLIREQPQLELLDRRLVQMEERNTVVSQLVQKDRELGSMCELGNILASSAPLQRRSTDSSIQRRSLQLSPLQDGRTQGLPTVAHTDPRFFSVTIGKEPVLKTLAFFKTFTPARQRADDPKVVPRRAFRPSACELYLGKSVHRLGKQKALREMREARENEMKREEVVETHKRFHLVWAMSGKGMPLCAEKLGAMSKQQETSQNAGNVEQTNVSPRNALMRRRASVAKQQAPDTTGKWAVKQAAPAPVVSLDRIQLPNLPPQLPGDTDHSVMYDALLHREDKVEKRIWGKPSCLPNPHRLENMKNLLDKASNFLTASQKKGSVGSSAVAFDHSQLLCEIQQCKDCTIPEPWEGDETSTSIVVTRDRQEFLCNAMMVLLLPSELSAIESHLMAGMADSFPPPEHQRGKKTSRKEKRALGDAARLPAGSGALLQGIATASASQRTQIIMAATNVEFGLPDRNTTRRLMNMLDFDSGLKNISLQNLTDAFANAYLSRTVETLPKPTSEMDDKCTASVTESKRNHRSPSAGRSRSDRRSGRRVSPTRSESRHVGREAAAASATKQPVLTLNTALLDLMLYLPFVRCRLEYFKEECDAAVKELGDLGDALPKRFSKLQAASLYYERLQEAMRLSGMSEESALNNFVDIEGILRLNAQEVGSYFRSNTTPV